MGVRPTKRVLWGAAVLLAVIAAVAAVLLLPRHADYGPLLGRWRQMDGGRILEIRSVDRKGKLDAVCLNPKPIPLSDAFAVTRDGRAEVFVQEEERGHAWSYYRLGYDAEAGRLIGVYHDLDTDQRFILQFVRE